jgi:hypothetical protein
VATGHQIHSGAECAKDLKTELYVRIPLAGTGVIPKHNDSRQRISRLSHR